MDQKKNTRNSPWSDVLWCGVRNVDESHLPLFQKTRALVTLFQQAGALLHLMFQFRTSWIKRFQRN